MNRAVLSPGSPAVAWWGRILLIRLPSMTMSTSDCTAGPLPSQSFPAWTITRPEAIWGLQDRSTGTLVGVPPSRGMVRSSPLER